MPTERDIYEMLVSFPVFVQRCGEFYGFSVPQIHLDMAKDLQAGHPNISIAAFRNAGKSFITELYCAWRIWLEPRIWIIVLAATSDLSESIVTEVRHHISQIPWLRHLKPSKPKNDRFTVAGISPSKWPTIRGMTSQGNLRGIRCDLLLEDDVLSSRDKHSPSVRARIMGELEANASKILNPSGRHFIADDLPVPQYARTQTICLHTPSDRKPLNFYQQETGNYWDQFELRRYPVLVDEKSVWEERFPTSVMLEERSANPWVFDIERQVDDSIKDDEHSLVRLSKIPQEQRSDCSLSAFVDPSMGGDEYAYCLAGLAKTNEGTRIYIDEVGGWRGLTSDEAAIEVLEVMRSRKTSRLYCEDNLPVSGSIRKLAKERGIPLAIEPFKSRGNKQHRFTQSLAPILNAGSVIMNPKVLSDPETVRQLRGLRATGLPVNDDRLDVLEFACSRYQDSVRYRDKKDQAQPQRARFA